MDKPVDSKPRPLELGPNGRLPREDPHRWADIVEETLDRQARRIVLLYILVAILGLKVVWDLLGWGDYLMTH